MIIIVGAPSTHTTNSDDHSKNIYFAKLLTLPLCKHGLIIHRFVFFILSVDIAMRDRSAYL